MSLSPCSELLHKICAPEQLVHELGRLPRPLVFSNGCFDILHAGHVDYLTQARALGKSLLLALNTDLSIQTLNKGCDRPINSLAERLLVVAGLASVNLVSWFEEHTPLNLIKLIQPDVLVKGGDWKCEQIVGAKEVLEYGGRVYSLSSHYQGSTTGTIQKIRAALHKN